ncbi:MAG: MFS transporter [Planctomycetota bacterium]
MTSWVLYDFANTIFYAVVVTRYLPLQLKKLTDQHFILNVGFFPSMLAAAFLAPWIGRWVGSRGVSRKAVAFFTIACCLFTAGLGFTSHVALLLIFFAFAQVFYQVGLVPYNNLLPSVASRRRMGLVSGLGVGIGYAGVIVSLFVADWIIQRMGDPDDYRPAYFVAAILFFVFTIPLLLFVREKPTVDQEKKLGFGAVLELLKDRVCRRFVIGNFLCSDALNAVLALITVYLVFGKGFDDARLLHLLIVLNVAAMVAGVLFGLLTDRVTPRMTMPLAAALLASAVGITHYTSNLDVAFWAIVLMGGPGVAGIWVAGRKWVVQLAPEGDVGTLFGFYGLSNKLSLMNLILFTLLADLTGGYTASVGVLILSLICGIVILLTVPNQRPGAS